MNAGIMLGGPVHRKVSPRTEFTLKVWRQQYRANDNNRTGNVDALLAAIQIPLLIEFRTNIGIRFAMGPGLELRTLANSEVVFETGPTGTPTPLNTDLSDDIRPLAFVFLFDVGYVMKNGLGFAVRADPARSDLFKEGSRRSRSSITDIAFCLEFDVNALKRNRAKQE
ncbi:MAG: hypothetical protein MUE88_02940 [Flavobacteriales bacterium]|jgi:hypothetical protein|nr:hypothetical protein [Flavobacteriales bacterium]